MNCLVYNINFGDKKLECNHIFCNDCFTKYNINIYLCKLTNNMCNCFQFKNLDKNSLEKNNILNLIYNSHIPILRDYYYNIFKNNLDNKCNHFDKEICTWVFEYACKNNDVHVLNYMYKIFKYSSTTAIDIASIKGNLSLVKYLHENFGLHCSIHAIKYASESGNLELVQYLHEVVKYPYSLFFSLTGCINNDHKDILKYFIEVVNIPISQYIIDWAYYKNSKKCIELLKNL